MDFGVLKSSGYQRDCDRDEVAESMATLTVKEPPPVAPVAPEPESKRTQKAHKEKKEKGQKKAHKTATVTINTPPEEVDKGKARKDAPLEERKPSSPTTPEKAGQEGAHDDGFAPPSVFTLNFVMTKPSSVDLVTFPLPVDPATTVAEVRADLLQKETYLRKDLQFFYEGQEMKESALIKDLNLPDGATVHLRNALPSINILPAFGEPFPLAYSGKGMTVVELLKALFESSRFHLPNPRFVRLSIAGADGKNTPIDLDKFVDWADRPLGWSTTMADLQDILQKNFWARPLKFLLWNTVGDMTAVPVQGLANATTVREMDAKIRKEKNLIRRQDAPPGYVYLYRQGDPPFGLVAFSDGEKPVAGQCYFSWRRPPPSAVKFHANTTTLEELGVGARSTLLLDIWHEQSNRWASEVAKKYTSTGIELRVASPSGRTLLLKTSRNDFGEILMWKLFCACGVPPEDQLLVHDGKQLQRDQSIGGQKVEPGATLSLVVRIRHAY